MEDDENEWMEKIVQKEEENGEGSKKNDEVKGERKDEKM